MLHTAVKELGLRPLVFHVDGGWNSELAVNNIQVLVEKLGVDLFTEVIDWDEMREFQLAMFRSGVPHLDVPQDMAFISTLYKFANHHGIKHILNGGNISTECVLMPLDILYWGTDMRHINDIISKHSTATFKRYPFMNVLYHKVFLRYLKGIKTFKPLNFIRFRKQQAIDFLIEDYGWKPYPQKHFESRFTAFFEGYWLPSRFAYDMRRNQFSSLILTGQMNRDEALALLETPSFDDNTILKECRYVASKLGISEDELMGFHEMPKKFYWDYKNSQSLFRIGEAVLRKLSITRRGGAF